MRGGRKRTRRNREGSAIATRFDRPRHVDACDEWPRRGPVLKRLMPKVPLIMYSAFGDGYVEQQASLLGISSVISKSEPVTAVVGAARSLLTQTAA